MFPLIVHDWVDSLQNAGYHIDYGTATFGEDTVLVRGALPGEVFDILSRTRKMYLRYPVTFPDISRSAYTELGLLYIDNWKSNRTRFYFPELPNCRKCQAEMEYEKRKQQDAAVDAYADAWTEADWRIYRGVMR